MKTPKLTFKKEPKETGLASVGRPHQSVVIKRNGKEVGRISAPYFGTPDRKWGVGFMVVKAMKDDNCEWRWAFMKQRHDTEADARAWVTGHADMIQRQYVLREADA